MTLLISKSEKHDYPITRYQEMLQYLTKKIEVEKPEEIHHSLVQAYANLYEMVEELMAESRIRHQIIHEEPEYIKNKILSEIVEKNHDYLFKNYHGEYVALTFDGSVVAHSESQVDLLDKIYNIAIPKNQIFIYSVPLA
ncbi:MAG: DUF5678 domain-containing protein [Nitrosarchaeum sp.]